MNTHKLSFAIIGLGRVGTALYQILVNKGHQISGLFDSNPAQTNNIAPISTNTISNHLSDLAATDIIIISVPDDNVKQVVADLEKIFRQKKLSNYIYHTSGALSSDIFNPVRKYNVYCASLHPVQTFSGDATDFHKSENIFFDMEGEKQAIKKAKEFVKTFNSDIITIEKKLKPVYHLACTMASNYLNTLLFCVLDILKFMNLSEKESLEILKPLLSTTLQNILENGVDKTLTGPISRGDIGTVEKHLAILNDKFSHYSQLYKELGKIGLKYNSVLKNVSTSDMESLRTLLKNKDFKHDE